MRALCLILFLSLSAEVFAEFPYQPYYLYRCTVSTTGPEYWGPSPDEADRQAFDLLDGGCGVIPAEPSTLISMYGDGAGVTVEYYTYYGNWRWTYALGAIVSGKECPPNSTKSNTGCSCVSGTIQSNISQVNPNQVSCEPITSSCPTPTTGACEKINPKNNGKPQCQAAVGNPVNVGTGNKFQEERIDIAPVHGLTFTWYYNSRPAQFDADLAPAHWQHSYARRLVTRAASVFVHRPDGKVFQYDYDGSR